MMFEVAVPSDPLAELRHLLNSCSLRLGVRHVEAQAGEAASSS